MRFGSERQQHGKCTGSSSNSVRMVGRQVQKHPGFKALPVSAKEKIANPVENLHHGAATARVRSEFLSVSEGEEHDAKLGSLQQRAAHDAGWRNLHGVDELERLRIVRGKESLMTHATSLTQKAAGRLDAGQGNGGSWN